MDESTAVLWHVASKRLGVLANHPALSADQDVIRLLSTPGWSKGPRPVAETDLPYAPIALDEIRENKSQFAVYLTYPHTPLVAELETSGLQTEASIYVHADGNPLTPSDPTLLKWLKEFGVQYRYCATGGHAAPARH